MWYVNKYGIYGSLQLLRELDTPPCHHKPGGNKKLTEKQEPYNFGNFSKTLDFTDSHKLRAGRDLERP